MSEQRTRTALTAALLGTPFLLYFSASEQFKYVAPLALGAYWAVPIAIAYRRSVLALACAAPCVALVARVADGASRRLKSDPSQHPRAVRAGMGRASINVMPSLDDDLETLDLVLADIVSTLEAMRRCALRGRLDIDTFRGNSGAESLQDIGECLDLLRRESTTIGDSIAAASQPLHSLLRRPERS